MKLLFVGDVDRQARAGASSSTCSARLVDRHRVDYTVVNVENSAGGFGVTPEVLAEIAELPIDVYTTGNHIWDKKEGLAICSSASRASCAPPTTRRATPGTGSTSGRRRPASRWR